MGADSSIYSLIRPIQAPDPLAQAGKAMTIQNLMGQQELQGLQTQQARQGMADEQAVREAYKQSGGDPAKLRELLNKTGSYKAIQSLDKTQMERTKADAELQKLDRENMVAFAAQRLKDRKSITTPEQWAAHRDDAIKAAGMFKTQEMRDLALRSAMSLPEQYDPQYVARSIVDGDKLFTPQMEEYTDGQVKRMRDKNPWTNPSILNAAPIQMQADPNAVLTDQRTRSEGAMNRGVTLRGQNMTEANNQRPVYDVERGGFASRPQPGKESTFTPVTGAPLGQKQVIANREDTDNLRKEFEAKPSVKAFRDVIPIAAAAKSAPDTRSGDIQMAYAVGKILDPASVVREGELKLTGQAATVLGRIEGELRTVLMGKGRLSPGTRAELNAMLENAVGQRKASFDAEKASYSGIVTRRGYKPEDVFIDTPATEMPKMGATPASGGWTIEREK